MAACLCTTLLGLGLARFAYTPLIPALIAAHWFSASDAVYLGAANIAGYLAGAVLAQATARRVGVRPALRGAMLLATASFWACAAPRVFAWFLAWRLASGFAGATLMVLAAPSVLPTLPERRRGLAGGVIFRGLGIGILGSGTVLPWLLRAGVGAAWTALGTAGALLTACAWFFLPPDATPGAAEATRSRQRAAGLSALCVAYAASAVAQVPAILFLADFVARGLGAGVAGGARMWAVFGAGALVGPLLAGSIADRIGFVAALRGAFAMQWVATSCLLAWPGYWSTCVFSLALGAGLPGVVVLVLGRSQELAGRDADARRRAWSFATVSYALGQALGAYGLSYGFAETGAYRVLFATAAVFWFVALLAAETSKRLSLA